MPIYNKLIRDRIPEIIENSEENQIEVFDYEDFKNEKG